MCRVRQSHASSADLNGKRCCFSRPPPAQVRDVTLRKTAPPARALCCTGGELSSRSGRSTTGAGIHRQRPPQTDSGGDERAGARRYPAESRRELLEALDPYGISDRPGAAPPELRLQPAQRETDAEEEDASQPEQHAPAAQPRLPRYALRGGRRSRDGLRSSRLRLRPPAAAGRAGRCHSAHDRRRVGFPLAPNPNVIGAGDGELVRQFARLGLNFSLLCSRAKGRTRMSRAVSLVAGVAFAAAGACAQSDPARRVAAKHVAMIDYVPIRVIRRQNCSLPASAPFLTFVSFVDHSYASVLDTWRVVLSHRQLLL
jgi:hypothetical protein